jgi:hypothetical protein
VSLVRLVTWLVPRGGYRLSGYELGVRRAISLGTVPKTAPLDKLKWGSSARYLPQIYGREPGETPHYACSLSL